MPRADWDLNLEGLDLPYEGITEDFIQKSMTKLVDYLGIDDAYCSIVMCDDACITEINQVYRDRTGATDVISFTERDEPVPLPEGMPEDLGEIYISLETAVRQAPLYENNIHQEVIRLLVHGVLHLLGYDHERSTEAANEMEALEEECALVLWNSYKT